MKLRGYGPITTSKVKEQLDFDCLRIDYYVWFAGIPIRIGWQYL